MKKLLFSFAIVSAFALSFSSCSKNKCYTCSAAGLVEQTICEDDLPEGSDNLDTAIDILELSGYTCSED